MQIDGLVLAAGMSRRMKELKPLMKIGSRTMIEQTIENMLAGGVSRVTVVLGYRAEDIRECLSGNLYFEDRIQIVYNREYEHTEMLHSVKIGILAMEPCDGFFLAPADMPAISSETYRMMIDAKKQQSARLLFPLVNGYRKHPPLIDWSCVPDILAFAGTGGLRNLWKQYEHETAELPIADYGCTIDADYPADYIHICNYLRLPATR